MQEFLNCVAQSMDCASPWRRGTYTYMHIRRYQIGNSNKVAVHSAHSQVQHRECVQIAMPELHIHLHDSSECMTVSLSACCVPLLVQVVNDKQNACTVNSLVTSDTPTMTVTPTIAMYNCDSEKGQIKPLAQSSSYNVVQIYQILEGLRGTVL